MVDEYGFTYGFVITIDELPRAADFVVYQNQVAQIFLYYTEPENYYTNGGLRLNDGDSRYSIKKVIATIGFDIPGIERIDDEESNYKKVPVIILPQTFKMFEYWNNIKKRYEEKN